MAKKPLPDTNDGFIHLGVSYQLPGYASLALTADATKLANRVDLVIAPPSNITQTCTQTLAANTPSPLLMPYYKSVEHTGTGLPVQWYAHSNWSVVGDTTKFCHTNAGPTSYDMMSDVNTGAGATWNLTTIDPLGSSQTYVNWQDYNSRFTHADFANENNKYGGINPWQGFWYDAAGFFAFGQDGLGNPPLKRNGSAYTGALEYLQTEVWLMGDRARTDWPNLWMWANGCPSTAPASPSLRDLADHFDGVTDEDWINPTSMTDFGANSVKATWIAQVNGTIKTQATNVQVAGGKSTPLHVIDYWKTVAGVAPSDTQLNIFRRFQFVTAMFANVGKLFVEFAFKKLGTDTLTINPYPINSADDSMFQLADRSVASGGLGAPQNTLFDVNGYEVTIANGYGSDQTGLYARKYARGVVLANLDPVNDRIFTADRNYRNYNTATTFNAGDAITLPHVTAGIVTARILVATGGATNQTITLPVAAANASTVSPGNVSTASTSSLPAGLATRGPVPADVGTGGSYDIPDPAFAGSVEMVWVDVGWGNLQSTLRGAIAANNKIDQALADVTAWNTAHPSQPLTIGIRPYAGMMVPGAIKGSAVTTSFSPTTGSASTTTVIGTRVTLTGSGFTNAIAVLFNGVGAKFSINSDTQISAFVPVGATTGPITLVTSVSGNTFSTVSASGFTVQ